MFLGNKDRIKMAKKIEEHAKTAIKIDPQLFLPYVILGIYYRELASLSWIERTFANAFFGSVPKGTFEDSEKMLLKALELDSGAMIAAFNLSKTYGEMDNTQKEREYLQKAVNMKIRDFRDKYTLPRAQKRLEELK
jgi:tetratricopeptide (TPR) repeat protein